MPHDMILVAKNDDFENTQMAIMYVLKKCMRLFVVRYPIVRKRRQSHIASDNKSKMKKKTKQQYWNLFNGTRTYSTIKAYAVSWI